MAYFSRYQRSSSASMGPIGAMKRHDLRAVDLRLARRGWLVDQPGASEARRTPSCSWNFKSVSSRTSSSSGSAFGCGVGATSAG